MSVVRCHCHRGALQLSCIPILLRCWVFSCCMQSVYNEEIFFLSHGSYSSPGVSVRAMDIMIFMNSKVECDFWECNLIRVPF